MKRMTLAGLALALAACWGPTAPAQTEDKDKDRDAGKRVTVRGYIAGVTVAGETAIDYSTRRAQTVELSYLTIVGSPVTSDKDKDAGRTASVGRRRHSIYVVWLTPKTTLRDATPRDGSKDKDKGGQALETTLDKIEVGDRVEVTFVRRELSDTSGGGPEAERARRHGRFRTYFGDADSLTILALPEDDTPRSEQDRDRDDDKDKVKSR
jgi:hypothetical protein